MLTLFTKSYEQQTGVTIVTGAIRTLTSSEADAGNIWISKQAVGKNQPQALEWGIYQPGVCVLGYDYMFNVSCSTIQKPKTAASLRCISRAPYMVHVRAKWGSFKGNPEPNQSAVLSTWSHYI